jgi:hypothetical protein
MRTFQRNICLVPLLVIIPFMFTATAFGFCRGGGSSLTLWHYEGTMGERYPIRMAIVIEGDLISGVYCYASQLKDIRLRGRLVDGGAGLILNEFDDRDRERITGHFEGVFPEQDPHGRFGKSKLQCEVMTGWWIGAGDRSIRLPFYLSLESQTGGPLENRYAAAGSNNAELVERNAGRFREAVRQRDKKTVASLIAYPVKVRIGKGYRKIKSAAMLVRSYGEIFTPPYVEAVTKAIPKYMFVRDQGIMLGSGEVWFGPDGKVITLNN